MTSLAKDEIIVSFLFPPRPAHTGDAYLRMTPRTEMDIAVVGVGVNIALDADGVCTAARVSLGAVAPTPLLVEAAGAALMGSRLDAAALDKLAQAAGAACRPIDDKRGTKEYRVKVAGVLAKRTALLALERARQNI
jgi:carbon-monoxide dehydrogenase medium subunit